MAPTKKCTLGLTGLDAAAPLGSGVGRCAGAGQSCLVRPVGLQHGDVGGYHDGVQSDATIGPTEHVLLFQLASDAAMHWCWGDVGAYYIFIGPADLRRGDFERANIMLECH